MLVLAVAAAASMFSATVAVGLWACVRREREDAHLQLRLGLAQPARPLLRRQGGWRARIADWLEQAGLFWGAGGFVVRACACALLFVAIGGFLAGAPAAILLAPLGPGVVLVWVMRKRRVRVDQVNAQLPHALELMLLGLRAGHSLPRALELAAGEVPPPAGAELRRVVDEHALGRPLEQAFSGLARRLAASEAVRTLVTGVLVLRQTGGNLIEVIERILETLEAQQQYRLRLRALTAESRSSGFILSLLPLGFAALAALADPSYVRLFVSEPVGRTLGVIALAMWICGVSWMRRMLRPEV